MVKIKKTILNTTFKVLDNLKVVFSNIFQYLHKKFLWGIFSFIDEKFFKFLFVGVLNTAFSYTIYAILITIGLIPNIALFFQYILGVLWNFKTTGLIVFQNNNNKLIYKFVASYIFTFIINSILLHILLKFINEYIAQAVLILPIALLSFLIFKFWVFRE
ncbi:MAG: GtrA family protein [Candidatus Gastranaerophilales bacterium]|nr:GtrA family protein [Candidatus Gastranaerophilales bacterium]